MFKNCLKVAFRNIVRHKGYSFLNMVGLAIGMACAILIIIWIRSELNFDRFHVNAHEIYRVVTEQHGSGQVTLSAETQFPLAPGLKNDFPGIINSARIFTKLKNMFVKYKDKSFNENNVLFVDNSFLEMFTFPFLKGNPGTALTDPYSIVLTEEVAYKYFGDEYPVGKTLNIDYLNKLTDFKVTGVLENIPHNSHLRFDFLIPFHIFNDLYADTEDHWRTADNYYTYVLLNKNASFKDINQKIFGYKAKHIRGSKDKLSLQPMLRIHLHSDIKFDISTNGNIKYIFFFSAIGVFVLFIACINFMNLATAHSAKRSREVGLRKVVGAQRSQIIKQFLGESLILSFIALISALFLVETFLPVFNNLSGKHLTIGYDSYYIYLFLLLITVFTGIVSGSYPALFLSSFKPVKILRGTLGLLDTGRRGSVFRKVLVLIQFSLSIILIVSTIVVSNQLDFMRNKDLGFDKKNLIYIPVRGKLKQKYQSLKDELLKAPNIEGVTAANILPLQGNESPLSNWEGNKGQNKILVNITSVDYDYFKTLDMQIVQGRGFSRDFPTDLSGAVIVNEEAVRQMGMKSPIGKRLWDKRILGVVKDYHYMSLYDQIEPIVISLTDRLFYNIFIKMSPTYHDVSRTIGYVKDVYKRFISDYPFEFHFLDADIDNFYHNEKRIHKLFTFFTFLAIFIACLGLFGLTSFMAEQRTKEIGVRKILGASVSNIILLLSKEYSKWVLTANIIAWPAAYIAMNKWLQNFAYRTNIGIDTYIMAGFLALLIALLTVGYQSLKAATANPVEALRYE